MMSEEIYNVLRDGGDKFGMWNTGYTYSGHPASAAVALETLKIYEERDTVGHVRSIMPTFLSGLKSFVDHPLVGEVRGVGLVGAIELSPDKKNKGTFDPSAKVAPYMVARANHYGLILRATPSDSVAFCPPLIISKEEIGKVMERANQALDDTWQYVKKEGLV